MTHGKKNTSKTKNKTKEYESNSDMSRSGSNSDDTSSDDINLPHNVDNFDIDRLLIDEDGNRFDNYNYNDNNVDNVDHNVDDDDYHDDLENDDNGSIDSYADEYQRGGKKDGPKNRHENRHGDRKKNYTEKMSRPDTRQLSRSYNNRSNNDNVREDVLLEDNKYPISRKINVGETDISKFEPNVVLHNDIDYPKFSLGFHHWIHASKNKTDIFNQFIGKKRVYQVVNGYERYVDDYDASIGNVSKEYFGLDKKDKMPNILSRAFYKLWEMLYYFDLIDVNDKNFISAHLAEGPGSFIQATMFFRNLHAKDSKNDKYYAVTIHSENEDYTQELEREFVEYYSKEKPQRFFMHKTFDTQTAGGSKTKDNGDLTKTKTIENFKKNIGDKVNFITGDGGFDWTNENIQEQECSVLIFAQILTALNIQKKGGSFVLKMFEMFTKLSAKFVMILKYFYEDIHITKPLTSRESNSERYIVCRKFKYDEKQISGILAKLMNVLDVIEKNSGNKPIYMIDIYPDISMPDDIFVNLLSVNVDISNLQFKVINKMIEYLDGSNFHGELYMRYRTRQIELSQYWIDVFMHNNKDHSWNSEKIQKILETAEKNQTGGYNKLKNSLLGYGVTKDTVKDVTKDTVKDVAKDTVKDDAKKSKPKISRSKSKSGSKSKSKFKSKSKSKSGSKDKKAAKKITKTKSKSGSKSIDKKVDKKVDKKTDKKVDKKEVKKEVKKTVKKIVKNKD